MLFDDTLIGAPPSETHTEWSPMVLEPSQNTFPPSVATVAPISAPLSRVLLPVELNTE